MRHRIATALLLALPGLAGAQSLRTYEIARQAHDSLPVTVRLEYDAGLLGVRGADQPLLYGAELTYDPRRAELTHRWDEATRTVRLGLELASGTRGPEGGRTSPELQLRLGRRAPVDLHVAMGAGKADLDLTAVPVARVRLAAGASDAHLHFDAANPVPMDELDLSVGAANVRATGLGNARARDMRVRVGVGRVELDYRGDWTHDVTLDLQVSIGQAVVRVPSDVGVRLEMRRMLASVERDGLVKRDDAWVSPNWDEATHRLVIRGRTAFGAFELQRGER